ncbi:hypothetical protein CEG14_18805 [Bordetella genomosp. 1]|uniref:TadE-like domain-containing protein n=1 Tax=Bordetella genomosp. 1 TaxID=1395607 RepID=A0A261S7H1_9BORD|nr:hypothetical protein CEG14_18805 [Bordetella genomosp. 1]
MQRGSYAVEFSLVFVVFFLVAYGLLTWGIIFAAQQSLNFAAEEGARAAQRWQAVGAWGPRATSAQTAAAYQIEWVSSMGGTPSTIAVCGPTGRIGGTGACSGLTLAADQIEVLVRYPYASAPLLPTLPGMGLVVPTELRARASVRLGGQLSLAAPAAAGL